MLVGLQMDIAVFTLVQLVGELSMLELVDAVQARHMTPVISIYCIVVAEPYFISFS
jgi:hypothetical protein